MVKRPKARLGLFERFFLNRRIKKIKDQLGKERDRFCDLAYRAEIEKSKAEHILTKAEFEKYEADIDKHFEDACNCAQGAEYKPRGERRPSAGTEAAAPEPVLTNREKCVDKIIEEGHKAGLFLKSGRTGKVTGKGLAIKFRNDDLNPVLNECEEKKASKIPARVVPAVTADVPVAISGIRRAKGGRR